MLLAALQFQAPVTRRASAIEAGPFGPSGEGGALNNQRLTIGPGGVVFQLDSFIKVGEAPAIQLSKGPLPSNLKLEFHHLLSEDRTDLTLLYSIRNMTAVSVPGLVFLSMLDTEIDEAENTFFNEFAEAFGELGVGAEDENPDGFEVDEIELAGGNVLTHLREGALDNVNAVPQDDPGCVVMALAFDLGTVRPFERVDIKIVVSEDGDRTGSFALTHRDADPRSQTMVTYSGRAGIFRRGDANSDGRTNITDPIFTLDYLFRGTKAPFCLDALDADDDGKVNITDAIFTLSFLFVGGRVIPPPHPGCGGDPSLDDLDCRSTTSCVEQGEG
jgi:hypothetical protein